MRLKRLLHINLKYFTQHIQCMTRIFLKALVHPLLISLVDHAYSKMLHEKSNSLLSFDIAYFTNSKQINNDIQLMQVELLRSFDLVTRGDFKIRILNKRCSTTDNVLHFLFDVNHCEISTETFVKMQKGITHTNMKEA